MITVILADDHTVLRDGLRYLLEAAGDIQILSMAANGQEAVEQATLHCPDVIVMDISMPIMSGIEATKHICKVCENTKVAILSMHHTTEYIQRAVNGIKRPKEVNAAAIEVKRIEEEGDAIYHEAVGELFQGKPDPLDVIRWKEMYDVLEETIDSCMGIVHVLQSISLKNA